ncbi:MAG: hypothetical protein H6707_09530 [Deltaproteobacteria bacterium]|nr:hypothetical protein [Deltaproteobacteria bacterium]
MTRSAGLIGGTLAVLCAACALHTAALANGLAMFRISGRAKATPTGIEVPISYQCQWGSTALNEKNKDARFYLFRKQPEVESFRALVDFHRPDAGNPAVLLGDFALLGNGKVNLTIPYSALSQLGLRGGEEVALACHWTGKSHIWGYRGSISAAGRDATVSLPHAWYGRSGLAHFADRLRDLTGL